ANASQDFLDRVPMETHYEFLGKMKKRLEGSKISGILIEDNALIAEINSPSESLRMILTLSELEPGALLLDGIKLE
ncbi:MAG: hypothetical protein KTR22_09480, partial [Flavobacteriaceae bacterium]|nr:hypothetical protein [Flavobacteriaceae bacterium]